MSESNDNNLSKDITTKAQEEPYVPIIIQDLERSVPDQVQVKLMEEECKKLKERTPRMFTFKNVEHK